jgi:hypothetical protein
MLLRAGTGVDDDETETVPDTLAALAVGAKSLKARHCLGHYLP